MCVASATRRLDTTLCCQSMDIVHVGARPRSLNWWVTATRVIALVTVCAAETEAQSVRDSVRTAHGYCRIWQAPPGGSNPPDHSYSPCAIDNRPKRLSGPDIPAPTLGLFAGGSIFITIRPDGSVDSALTRPYTLTGDTSFDHHALKAVRQWRFEQPLRSGVPVRAALTLQIESTSRDDTLPAHLVWQHIEGANIDTASARWVVDRARPPALAPIETDSVYAAVFRELIRLQVLSPNVGTRYCLTASSPDSFTLGRLELIARQTLRRGPVMVASAGCERDVQLLRLVLSSVYRTENDRVVVFPRGDFLPAWPPGLDAKSWRAWHGRCVGRMFADGHAAMACGVNPIISMTERTLNRSMVPSPPGNRPWIEGDSVRFTVHATRRGAFLVDTLRFAVASLPRLEQRAVSDSLLRSDSNHPKRALVTAPAAVVRVSELRHETQLGVVDLMRIFLDHGPADVGVFVAYRGGTQTPWTGDMARNTGERRWDFGVNLDGGRLDAEYSIYLFRRLATSR